MLRVLSLCLFRSLAHCLFYVLLSLQGVADEEPAGLAVVPDTPGAAGSAAADVADASASFISMCFLSFNPVQ